MGKGRAVKCQVTNEIGNSNTFFKAPNGKYYKTAEIYYSWRREEDARLKCIDVLCDYCGYKGAGFAPTLMMKIISEFGTKFGYDVLFETLIQLQKQFEKAVMNKDFNSETSKLLYFKAMISNNIVDVQKQVERSMKNQRTTNQFEPGYFDFDLDKIGCPTGGGKDLSIIFGEDF